jgi:hypothetical protein
MPIHWNPRRRAVSREVETAEIKKFNDWLGNNYPGLVIPPINKTPSHVGYAQLASGIFLQILVSGILGITHYKVGVPSHACWLVIWIHGGPMLRWLYLFTSSMDKEPCLSPLKVWLFELVWVLTILIGIGVYGGITVISVELLGAFCETTISLPAGIWIGIGVAIAFVLLVIPHVILYYRNIFGI